jgi:hypothetical protein
MTGADARSVEPQRDFRTRAQLTVLAETLDVEPERLAHLDRLGAENLRSLRERISARLFDEQAAVFAKLNRLAPLVPNGLVARLSEAIVPPLVAGRAAGALGLRNPERATAVLTELSPEYMADCAPYLDQRAVAVLAPTIPAELLAPAANVLMARRAYLTASWFLDYATPELVRELEAGIEDKAGLLRTTALVQSDEQLDEIVRALPRDRVAAIVRSAVGSPDLLVAGLSVLSRLSGELVADLGEPLFAELDDDGLAELARTAVQRDATAELLAVAAALPARTVRRLAANPALTEPEALRALADTAAERGDWAGLERIAEHLTGEPARLVAELIARARPAAS